MFVLKPDIFQAFFGQSCPDIFNLAGVCNLSQ